jgi:hypothetical protein
MSKALNFRLYVKGETLRHAHTSQVFEEIVRESYYAGRQHEFLGLTKPEIDKTFAFLTLTSEEARDTVLNEGLSFKHKKLQVSVTRDRGTGNPSELRISTTLVANNLPQRESQASITKVIKQAFGADNIVGVSFGTNPHSDKQAGWCHIQCLNAAVYTEWLHRSTFILGRRIDFIPHHGSIDGTDPNNTTIRLAQAPAREAIAEKIQAMGNVTNTNPIITEKYLTKTMKEFEDKLDVKFETLTTTINTHTDRKHEGTTATITHHTNNLQALFGTIAQELQQSNLRMQGLVNGLANAAPEILQRATLPPLPHGYNTTVQSLPFQAPRASTTTHKYITKDTIHLMNSDHPRHHQWSHLPIFLIICCIAFSSYNKKFVFSLYTLVTYIVTHTRSNTTNRISTITIILLLASIHTQTQLLTIHQATKPTTYINITQHLNHNSSTYLHHHNHITNLPYNMPHTITNKPPIPNIIIHNIIYIG